MSGRITIAATAAEWTALLALVPRCVECRGPGELRLDGRVRCVPCASRHRRGRCETPPWADVATRIHDAIGATP